MKKLFLVAVLGLGLLVLALGAGLFFSDSLIKTAVERGGTFALGVPTTLESAELGLFSGRLGLRELAVENPPGFEQPHFLRLEQADFELTIESLGSDLIEVPLLSLDGLTLTLEKRGGETNYAQILSTLQALQNAEDAPDSPAPDGETSSDPGSSKQFVIREVLITNVSAQILMLPQGGRLAEVSITIPEIRLQDVGQNGESLPQIIGELTRGLLSAVVEAGGVALPEAVLADLESSLASMKGRAFELGEGVITKIEDLGKELSEGLGSALGEQADALLDTAGKDLDKQLKKLFD